MARTGSRTGRSRHGTLVRGWLLAQGTGARSDVLLRIPSATVVAGEGIVELLVEGPGLRLVGDSLAWIVRTSDGWMHLRGSGRSRGDETPVTFRLDIHPEDGDGSAIRLALRIYEPGADAGTSAPTHRITGVLTSE